MNMLSLRLQRLSVTLATLFVIQFARAQTAANTADPTVNSNESKGADGRDVYRMTPFEVASKKSPGAYVQEDVVSVTKFAIPLIDVPQNIFVFNRAYLDDLNTGQLRDSLAYNASIQGGLYSTGGSYRGFSNQEKLKDGFKTSAFFDYDGIHFERIELLKGPSAVMYGRTEPGGITNYVSKRPIPGQDFATITVGTGLNYKNVRQNFNWDINESFQPVGHNSVDFRITGAFREYQDSRDSQTDNGKQRQGSIRIAGITWLTDTTRIYASYSFYQRYFNSQFGRYASFAVAVPQATPGASIPFSILYGRNPFEDYGYGRQFYWQYNETQVVVDQKISSTLDFRFGFNLHKRTNEDYLLNIAPTTLNGQGAIAQTGIQKNKNDSFYPDLQAHLMWKPIADQSLLLGFSKNWAFDNVKQWFQNLNPDGSPFRRVYIPANGIPHSLPTDVIYVPTLFTGDLRTYTSFIANYVGGYFQNSLHVMAGIAHNETKTTFAAFDTPKAGPNFSTTDNNPQAGVIYKLIPSVSAFVLGSESTQFTLTKNSFNQYFGPVKGVGYEGGFKFAFMGGRFNGTLTYYNVDQEHNVVFDPLATSFAYQQTVAAGTPNPALLGDNVAAGTTNSAGEEFELNGVILPNWNLTLSYAHDRQIFKSDPQSFRRGSLVPALEPNKLTIFTRYDFTASPFHGLFVAGGIIYIDKVYGGFSPGSNNTKTYWAKGGTRLDATVGYKWRGGGREQSLRLQGIGINQPVGFSSGFDPVANDKYYLKAKPIINLDYTITF